MEKITNYVIPGNLNSLYKNEASSTIGLARDVAEKLNEVIDYVNNRSKDDLTWKQTQEGIIRKGVIYMKDNLVNSLSNLFRVYDDPTIRNTIIEMYGEEISKLQQLNVFVTPQMFGAKGDGETDDKASVQNAINSLKNGGILYFPEGTYLLKGLNVYVPYQNITITGPGKIVTEYGFRITASNFKAIGLNMEGLLYSTACRGFVCDLSNANGDTSKYVENITIKDCKFNNFFYAVACIGGSYNYDGTESAYGYPVRDVVIENCYSSTYTDQNAGHFQCIQVENIAYVNNRTYGGQNASSYNAIKGNGYIRVIGNYDHNNSYASCEIENGSGKAVIANNTFNSKIWVDDSFDVVVNGNTTEGGISVTVGSNNGDAENIVISNNTTKNIRCEQFGTYEGGLIKNVNIIGNVVNGTNTHGIWIHGNAVTNAKIANNFISGTNATNDIAITRNAQLTCYISGNFGNNKQLLITGTGGKVFAVDNYNMTSSGNRDSLPASHLEREFNGIKILDDNKESWRIGVTTSGVVNAIKY